MADKKQTTQSQQADQAADRAAELLGRFTLVRANAVEQMRTAIGEYAKLTCVTLDYANDLTTQWQDVTIAQMRELAKVVAPLHNPNQ